MHHFYLCKICALEVLFNDNKDLDGCFIVSDISLPSSNIND